MNATEIKGQWEERFPRQNVVILYDTTKVPEEIRIQKKGENPIVINFPEGIQVLDTYRARAIAKEAYNIELN